MKEPIVTYNNRIKYIKIHLGVLGNILIWDTWDTSFVNHDGIWLHFSDSMVQVNSELERSSLWMGFHAASDLQILQKLV